MTCPTPGTVYIDTTTEHGRGSYPIVVIRQARAVSISGVPSILIMDTDGTLATISIHTFRYLLQPIEPTSSVVVEIS